MIKRHLIRVYLCQRTGVDCASPHPPSLPPPPLPPSFLFFLAHAATSSSFISSFCGACVKGEVGEPCSIRAVAHPVS